MLKNVIYRATYIGESARSTYERAREHLDLINKIDPESPIIEHKLECHRDNPVSSTMEVIRKVKRPLQWQTLEGLLIAEQKGGPLLNRKGE